VLLSRSAAIGFHHQQQNQSEIGIGRFSDPHAFVGGRHMSWKIEVQIDDSGEWEGDDRRFAIKQRR
jgi:hypothetical protein